MWSQFPEQPGLSLLSYGSVLSCQLEVEKHHFLATFSSLVQQAREKLKISRIDPAWLLDEASFEKMGELMAANHSKLLGMYDELSTFLAQINIYRGKGLADSHDLATFLSLYNGKSWTRATGKSRSIS